MKVLITGGAGNLSRLLCEQLEARHELTLFDLVQPKEAGHRFVQGDLTVLAQVEEIARGMDAIVHLGAIIIDTGEAEKIWHVNNTGTFNVLEAAARNGVRKVLFASSICAVGMIFWKKPFTPDYFPVDEDHPAKPDDSYGLSKLIGEKLCYAYSQRYDIHTVCFRIGPVWYPLDPLSEFNMNCLKGVKHPAANKEWIWCYVDGRDVAQAFRLGLEREGTGQEIFNVGADDICAEVPSLELVRQFYPGVKWINNANRFVLEPFAPLWDISKAKQQLGYQPNFTWRDYAHHLDA